MNRKSVQISHDAFSRVSIYRRVVNRDATEAGCDFCGRPRYRMGKPLKTLYQYGAQSDDYGAALNWTERLFCSKSCLDAYY